MFLEFDSVLKASFFSFFVGVWECVGGCLLFGGLGLT